MLSPLFRPLGHARCRSRLLAAAAFVAALLLSACGPDKNHVRIKGHFRGVNQAEFYLYDEMGSPASFDTVKLENGRFEIEKEISERRVLNLLFPNFSELSLIAEPGKTIDIEADANKLAEVDIAGSKDNELLTKFRQENIKRTDADKRLAAADFIRQHPNTVAAQAVFMTYFVKADALQPPAGELLNLMARAQPRNSSMRAIRQRILPLTRTAPGQPMPSLQLTDLYGQRLQLPPVAGRPTLVVFWATWAKNMYGLMRVLRQVHRTYGQRLSMVFISLDYDQEQCRRRVKSDTIPGRIICDGRAFESPIVQQTGLTSVPTVLLLDEQGRIKERIIETDNLADDIDRLMR